MGLVVWEADGVQGMEDGYVDRPLATWWWVLALELSKEVADAPVEGLCRSAALSGVLSHQPLDFLANGKEGF